MATAGVAEYPALSPCCPAVGERFAPVADLAKVWEKLKQTDPEAPGFQFGAWNGDTAVCTWEHAWLHILDRHGVTTETWPRLLHTVQQPCVVVEQEPVRGRQRFALYRIDPGDKPLFSVVLDRIDLYRFLVVTAVPRLWLADQHQVRIPQHLIDTCPGYCARRQDQSPYAPIQARWSSAVVSVPVNCCDGEPGPCSPDRRKARQAGARNA